MQKKILNNLLEAVLDSTLTNVVVNLLLALLSVFLFWETHSHLMLKWFVGFLILMAIRVGIYYQKEKLNLTFLYWLTFISLLATAIVWTILLWVAFDERDFFKQLFVIYVITGLSAGAIVSLSPIFKFYAGYVTVLGINMVAWFLAKGEKEGIFMALPATLYYLFMIFGAKKLNEILVHTLTLRFEKEQMFQDLKKTTYELKTIFNSTPIGIFFFDKELKVLKTNPYLTKFLDNLLPSNLKKINEKEILNVLQKALQEGKKSVYEGKFKNLYIRLLTSPVVEEGKIIGGLGIVEDISKEIKSKEQRDRFAQFYLKNPNPVFQVECKKHDILLKNSSFSVIRDSYPDLKELIFKICQKKEGRIEIKLEDKTFQLELIPIKEELINVYAQDITSEKNAREEANFYAYYDELTKLPRKKLFTQYLQEAIQNSKETSTFNALLFIDVDDFKKINDNFRHEIGDQFLIILSNRLQNLLSKEGGFIARLGGDEFAILLPSLGKDKEKAKERLKKKAQEILEVIKEPVQIENLKFEVSASIGAVLFKDATIEEIFRDADIAMYEAKKRGKDAIYLFNEELKERYLFKSSLIDELKEAILLGELQLFLQPQIDLKSDKLFGAEALVRWNHPTRGLILPHQFLEIAEDSGVIVDLDLWSFQQATYALKQFKVLKFIAINVGARSFKSSRFLEELSLLVSNNRINPSKIVIELTENIVIQDYFTPNSKIKYLKKLGFKFAIDDFGTGYSSLSYIEKLALDMLKIDRSLVSKLGLERGKETLTKIAIEIAKNLKMKAVAEGIETRFQLEFLKELGCDIAQGFYFSKPLPFSEFEKFLKTYKPK
ncbi:MAG: EAL domain-containing protein [Epsilonproteobacteria bacterium]|nr:EAL domain-containing protein [Campylobacterota bacterium]